MTHDVARDSSYALLTALGLWIFSALGASAQQCTQGIAMIGGLQMNCAATICLVPGLDDIARGGSGQLYLHPNIFQLPSSIQQFIFAHECAHVQGIANEQMADCQAICWGKQSGVLTLFDLQQLCQALWLTPGDWTHFPGPGRCGVMVACYQSC